MPHVVGRYTLYEEIASGGMASVHYGRMQGLVGFSRTVAIKRLHPQFAKDPEFVSMFLDEARLAGRIHHPNVVQTLDVVALEGELFLVMDYVQGESLGKLVRAARTTKQPIPLPVVSAILGGALQGLHAAHQATNERGEPLHLVHRDVSPQNILVGADGVPRVLDFGVAKAAGRIHTTREGQVKGKLAYMAPETLTGGALDRRTDVYAVGVVLWETLTRQRLFAADNEGAVVASVLNKAVEPPSSIAKDVPKALDDVTMRALEREPGKRFDTARDMAVALEAAMPYASATRLTEWVQSLAGELLAQRSKTVARIENDSGSGQVPHPVADPAVVAAAPMGHTPVPAPSPSPAPSVDVGTSSQVSSVTASTSAVRRQVLPSRPRRWAVAAVPAAAIIIAVLILTSMRRAANPVAPASSAPSVGPSVITEAIPPPPASDTTIPSPASAASVVASAAAIPAPPLPLAPPTAGNPARPSRPRPAAPAKPCSIRSYVDDTGITHFVKDCQ